MTSDEHLDAIAAKCRFVLTTSTRTPLFKAALETTLAAIDGLRAARKLHALDADNSWGEFAIDEMETAIRAAWPVEMLTK